MHIYMCVYVYVSETYVTGFAKAIPNHTELKSPRLTLKLYSIALFRETSIVAIDGQVCFHSWIEP